MRLPPNAPRPEPLRAIPDAAAPPRYKPNALGNPPNPRDGPALRSRNFGVIVQAAPHAPCQNVSGVDVKEAAACRRTRSGRKRLRPLTCVAGQRQGNDESLFLFFFSSFFFFFSFSSGAFQRIRKSCPAIGLIVGPQIRARWRGRGAKPRWPRPPAASCSSRTSRLVAQPANCLRGVEVSRAFHRTRTALRDTALGRPSSCRFRTGVPWARPGRTISMGKVLGSSTRHHKPSRPAVAGVTTGVSMKTRLRRWWADRRCRRGSMSRACPEQGDHAASAIYSALPSPSEKEKGRRLSGCRIWTQTLSSGAQIAWSRRYYYVTIQ